MKQSVELNNQTILVTGSPGFIGANLVMRLLRDLTGGHVISFDNMNDYYDLKLKFDVECIQGTPDYDWRVPFDDEEQQ